MIQVRSQYDNVYIKILDKLDTFEYTLQKIRYLPGRAFNMQTGEWMISRDQIGSLLLNFNNQISWMTPLHEIVAGLDIQDEVVTKHLEWEAESEFKDFKLSLYPYQKVGANFLIDRGCAAVFDGCGLGKTPQLIGACEKIFDRGGKKALIVTLSSLKRQWAKEIGRFTGKEAIAVTGTNSRREKLIKGFASHPNAQYLVINYEMLRTPKLLDLIKSIPFDVVGLDEAQKIKNGVTDVMLDIKPSQNAACAHQLKYIPHRFIATATPLQGKAEEVWSLFYFLDENILGNWIAFRERYCMYSKKFGITGYLNLGELYYRIAPYFIRRTKEDPEIQQQLPDVQHSHIFLDMTDKQVQLHDYLLEQYAEVKEAAKKVRSSAPGSYHFISGKSMSGKEAEEYYDALIQGFQIFLLGVCDSPELLLMSESGMAKKILEAMPLSGKDLKSPKIEHIVDFYEQMLHDEPNSKVVIFTQFKRMAQLIQARLKHSVIYHGGLSDNMKEWNKTQFVESPEIKAIVCTDAGSTGLNLQVANYMIHADLPWDPTLVEQRNGRIDRTGNKFGNVTIYYTVMSNSFDEHILEILERKADLATAVIDGGRSTAKQGSINISKLAMDRLMKQRQKNNKGVSAIAT